MQDSNGKLGHHRSCTGTCKSMRARSTQHCQGTTGRDLSIHCILPLFYFLLVFFSTEYFALENHSIAKLIYKRNCNFNSFLNCRQYFSIWEWPFSKSTQYWNMTMNIQLILIYLMEVLFESKLCSRAEVLRNFLRLWISVEQIEWMKGANDFVRTQSRQ